MASIKLTPSSIGDDHQYASIPSNYPLTNLIGQDSDNTSTYAGIQLTTGRGAVSYYFIEFDTSQIPENAVITSITAKVRIYGMSSGKNHTNTRQIQLYSGDTAKGSATNVSIDTSNVATISDPGEWTREELNDLKLRYYLTRGTSNTPRSTTVYLQGADITIEYEELTNYNITIQASEDITTDKQSTNIAAEGSTFQLKIFNQVDSITDNGVNAINSLVETTSPSESQNVTSYPTGYTSSGTISGTRYQDAVGQNSSSTATGNDYSNGGSSSTATITYSFDFSSIPEDAIIESVSVNVGGHCESTSQSSARANLQLYSGSTAKGSSSSFTTTSKQVVTMNAGTWTRAELQEATLQFTIGYYGGLVNGVDFIVTYSLPNAGQTYYLYTIQNVAEDHIIIISSKSGTNLYINQNGTVVQVQQVYIKLNNNSWAELTELDKYFIEGHKFQRG